jgi:hypothetical protein
MGKLTWQSEVEMLQLQLAEQRKKYEDAFLHGENFEELKKIFVQIKDLQKSIESCIEKAKQSGKFR